MLKGGKLPAVHGPKGRETGAKARGEGKGTTKVPVPVIGTTAKLGVTAGRHPRLPGVLSASALPRASQPGPALLLKCRTHLSLGATSHRN